MASRRTRSPGPPAPGNGDTLASQDAGDDAPPYLREPEGAEWLALPSPAADEGAAPRHARSLPPMPFAGVSTRLSSNVSGLLDNVLSRGDFRWSERNHRDSALSRQVRLLPALALALLVVLAAGTFAWVLASKAASQATIAPKATAPAASGAPGGLILQPHGGAASPTPQAAHYLIGAWLAQVSPSGGATQVFVRVSHDNAPVAGVPVSITVSLGGAGTDYGPIPTDGYGLATFNVFIGASPGTPGYLAAHATVDGQALSFDQSFVTSAYAPAAAPTQPPPEQP